MKVQLEKEIVLLNGNKIPDADGKNMSVKDAIITALTAAESDQKITGEQKFKRYNMAQKISTMKSEGELTAEEITEIKKRIGEVYAMPEVIGFVFNTLEGN